MSILDLNTATGEIDFPNPEVNGVLTTSGAIRYTLSVIDGRDFAYVNTKDIDAPEKRRYFIFKKENIISYTVNRKQTGTSTTNKEWFRWQRLATVSFSFRPRGNSTDPKINIYLRRRSNTQGNNNGLKNITSDIGLIQSSISTEHLGIVIEHFNEMYEKLIGKLPLDFEEFKQTRPLNEWFRALSYPITEKIDIGNVIPFTLSAAMREKTIEGFTKKVFGKTSPELEDLIQNSSNDKLYWVTNFAKLINIGDVQNFLESDEDSTLNNFYPKLGTKVDLKLLRQILRACDYDTRINLLTKVASNNYPNAVLARWETYKTASLKNSVIKTESWETLSDSFKTVSKDRIRKLAEDDIRLSDDNLIKLVEYFIRGSSFELSIPQQHDLRPKRPIKLDKAVLRVSPYINPIKLDNNISLLKFGMQNDYIFTQATLRYDDELKKFNKIFIDLAEEWQREENFFTKKQVLNYMKNLNEFALEQLKRNKVPTSHKNVLKYLELMFCFVSSQNKKFVNISTKQIVKFPKVMYWYLKNNFTVEQTLMFYTGGVSKADAETLRLAPIDWVEALLGIRPLARFYNVDKADSTQQSPFSSF